MNTLKSILLSLALVFASIAIFETGARYGSTNMRAYAIAEQLHRMLQIRLPIQSKEHGSAELPIVPVAQIDALIATGAKHRKIWYLNKKAKQPLEQSLAYALALRGGDNVIKSIQENQSLADANPSLIDELIAAIKEAQVDLIDNAPSAKDKTSETQEAEATEAE